MHLEDFDCTSTSHTDPEWIEEVDFSEFYMNPWSFSEIIQVRPFIGNKRPCKEQQLWHLYNKFGASLGDLAKYAPDPATYERLVVNQITTMKPTDLRYISYNPDSTHHHIFTIFPSPTNRYVSEKRIASRYVLELLWEKLLQHQIYDMRYFCVQYRASAITAADAKWIFESRIHQFLRNQQTIRLFPVLRDGPRSKSIVYNSYLEQNSMDLRLRGSDECPLAEGADFRVNTYHRISADLPGVDSLIIIHSPSHSPPILLIFWIAHNTGAHDVSEEGFRMINTLGLPPDTRKYYVVVTPGGVKPEIRVPKAYFAKGRENAPGKVSWVFNYPIPTNVLLPES